MFIEAMTAVIIRKPTYFAFPFHFYFSITSRGDRHIVLNTFFSVVLSFWNINRDMYSWRKMWAI